MNVNGFAANAILSALGVAVVVLIYQSVMHAAEHANIAVDYATLLAGR